MANIDRNELQAFERRAKQLGSEVKALCAAGKKTEALAKAQGFRQEAEANDALQALKKCGEAVPNVMPKAVAQLTDKPAPTAGSVCGGA